MSVGTRSIVGAAILFGTLLLPVSPAASLESFAVYEDWKSGLIRSNRWQGNETFGGQEVGREVRAGVNMLELRYRHQGSTASNTGGIFANNSLNTANPAQISEIAATFMVESLSMTTCAANNSGAVTQVNAARLGMAKFNDGSGSAGNATGDYRAFVAAGRSGSSTDPDGVLKVTGFLLRCADAPCNSRPTVLSTTLATTVAVGQTFTLRLIWDQPNHQFLFGVNDSVDTALPYSASDASGAIVPFVQTDVSASTANCTAGAVAIDATTLVGTVKTNSSGVLPAIKTFTVPPCRVLDTRISTPSGPIPANGTLSILVAGDLTGGGTVHQGGAPNCGVPEAATGVFINVVAVNAGGPGHLTVYPFNIPLPLAAALNFTTGQTIANGILVPICTPAGSCAFDLNITMGPAAALLVIDVTGYLMPTP